MRWGAPRGLAVAIPLFLAGLSFGTGARADIASAEALFREGRDLLGAGKVAEACLKFQESQRQDPSPGTLLNLAACHAKQGKAASAWAEYLAAKRAAQTANRTDMAEEAQRQADQVAPQRSFLTLIIERPAPGLKLSRNGEALDAGSFGSKLPTDPGRYAIVASAPGRLDWHGEITVEGGGDDKQLQVPELKEAPPEPNDAATGTGAVAGPPGKPSKVPYIVGGIGLGVTVVGLAFGGLAQSKYTSATDACPTRKGCSADALDDRDTAQLFANVSNVTVGVGLATVATGVVLLLTRGSASERPQAASFTFAPLVAPDRAGALLSGGF